MRSVSGLGEDAAASCSIDATSNETWRMQTSAPPLSPPPPDARIASPVRVLTNAVACRKGGDKCCFLFDPSHPRHGRKRPGSNTLGVLMCCCFLLPHTPSRCLSISFSFSRSSFHAVDQDSDSRATGRTVRPQGPTYLLDLGGEALSQRNHSPQIPAPKPLSHKHEWGTVVCMSLPSHPRCLFLGKHKGGIENHFTIPFFCLDLWLPLSLIHI